MNLNCILQGDLIKLEVYKIIWKYWNRFHITVARVLNASGHMQIKRCKERKI